MPLVYGEDTLSMADQRPTAETPVVSSTFSPLTLYDTDITPLASVGCGLQGLGPSSSVLLFGVSTEDYDTKAPLVGSQCPSCRHHPLFIQPLEVGEMLRDNLCLFRLGRGIITKTSISGTAPNTVSS